MEKIENFVNGKIEKSNSNDYLNVLDPSKGEVIKLVCN